MLQTKCDERNGSFSLFFLIFLHRADRFKVQFCKILLNKFIFSCEIIIIYRLMENLRDHNFII